MGLAALRSRTSFAGIVALCKRRMRLGFARRLNQSGLDTGAALRVLCNHALILIAAKALRLKTILDFGGGDGLLCRLLRDRGLAAETMDEYASPSYALAFEGSLSRQYDLITAFEVFEHLPEPGATLDELFRTRPRFMIASTEVYSGQDSNWGYLGPPGGGHVFFYSRDGLQRVAQRNDYVYYPLRGWHMFAREPLTRAQSWAMWILTSSKALRAFRATLPFSETWMWILQDHHEVLRRLDSGSLETGPAK
jgi:methyltransferase family protein